MSNRYIVVKNEQLEDFQNECAQKLEDGYVPLGGLVVNNGIYMQSFEKLQDMMLNEHFTGSY
jgi:hypothetical protein